MTKKILEQCDYLMKIKEKQKEQNKVKSEEGARSEKFLTLAEEIRNMRANAPYGMNTTGDEAKRLLKDTCYTDEKENKNTTYHEFSLHLIQSAKNTEEANEMVTKIESHHNTASDFPADEGTNHQHMIALGKQFGFINVDN